MEWREQTTVSCDEAYPEAQRWIEAVTKKTFGSKDFRSALENGVLLCELINKIKPGTIIRVNRLPTPIAGLDNLNVFLKACLKLGLKEAQLFHPGDLQDLSTRVTVKHQETSRRLKNVLITIYWLGRRAQCDRYYNGPYLNFKAFEGLLGTALYKALHESNGEKGSSIRDSGFGDSWYSEQEEIYNLREEGSGGETVGHRREDSLDSLDSLASRARSISSGATLKGSSEGCWSDAEADSIFSMAENKNSISYRRSLVITPKATAQFNQFLPTKDKQSGYVPAPLRKKRAEQDSRRSWASLSYSEDEGVLTSHNTQSALPATHHQWGFDYESGSDSDTDRPDPDLVLDDLASRRFNSPSPAPPTNFAVPISPSAGGRVARGKEGPWPTVTVTPSATPQQNLTFNSKSRKTQLPKHSSVKVEHHPAVNTDSLFRDMYDDSEDEDDEVGYADPVQDDLYTRKMGVKPQPANSISYDRFLPKFWTPEEEVHIQKIKLGSQRRPWYKKMQGFSSQKSGSSSDDSDCGSSPWLSSAPSPSVKPPSNSHAQEASAHTALVVGKRQQNELESMDGSKSTSDIMEPTITQQNRFEELQKYREQIKQGEDKWQDDLSKWKSRRRSVNSDIVKKKEEREKIEQITYGSDRKSKTFKEMQEERDNKGKGSISSRLKSLSVLDDEDDSIFETVSPYTRAFPSRSYTIDTPYYSSESFEPSQKTQEPPAASPPTRRPASPLTSQKVEDSVSARHSSTTTTVTSTPTPASHSFINSSHSPAAAPEPKTKADEYASTTKTQVAARPASSFSYTQEEPEPKPLLLGAQTEVDTPPSGALHNQPPLFSSMEPKPPAVSRVSASLPRSYQRPDSTRLTSVVAPRPFGSQSSRIASLPRAYTVDNTNKGVNGDINVSKITSVPSRYQQFMTSEDEAQSSSAHSSEEEEEEEEEEEKRTKEESIPSTQNISSVMPHAKNEAPAISAPVKDASKENFCDIRISLNQKPNSSRDFGFHATWDSTGARVTSIQPGSPAEMCQLQVGDDVLSVNGHKVAEMSYTEWRSCLETALQEGSLVMDVRRHGQNSSPETKTIKPSLDFTSRTLTETVPAKETPIQPFVDVASNRVNGNLQEEPVTMRNKESEPLSLKNLKRRSEFFEQGGSESAMPNIPVPAITPSSSRWSWDPEEERKRQEKWQKEQERLLQEKYKRDQEKLKEEWLKDQQDIVSSGVQQEVNSHNMSPHAPPSSAYPPTPSLWEEEEWKRKVEQERQRQAEERRKRVEEERHLQQLQEERKRREMQEEEEKMRVEEEKMRVEEERKRVEEERKRVEEERKRLEEERKRLEEENRKRNEEEGKRMEEEQLRWQRRREEEEERRRQEAVEQQRRERALEQQQQQQQQWTRSKSTSQLDEEDAPPRRGVHVQHGGTSQWLLKDKLTVERHKRSQRAEAEWELDWRNNRNAMRYSEAAIVSGADRKGQQQPVSQAELERQQILREMKKTTSLVTDNSWIRQRSSSTVTNRECDVPPMRRGESLDNLDSSSNSWRSARTPRSSSFVQNYSRPQPALYGNSSFYTGGSGAQRPSSVTLPSSYSMGSLRVGAGTHSSPWSRQSLSTPSPTSPESITEAGGPQQNSRSVSGKKICAFCDTPLGKGAAMIIESLELCYHLSCFKCIDCKVDLGGSKAGIEVRIRNKQLYCNSCYMRFKSAQPTSI